ncbi:MAG: NAD-dependent epimerase/dehydratase family protein, partial [Pseudobdellovibrionaceae bacterium]
GLFKSYHPDYKDGEQKRDFVYVKDVTSWIFELMNHKAANGIYNMGNGRARTWLDLTHAVFKAMDKKPEIHWLEMPQNLRNQYQYYTEAPMKKWLSQGLSKPKWTLEAGVADYVKNYLALQSTQDLKT